MIAENRRKSKVFLENFKKKAIKVGGTCAQSKKRINYCVLTLCMRVIGLVSVKVF